jgi:chemotaxis methyl-accepting protein methylase/mannose-6-phosphate isomerase-like protein (cupin superfamily)
VSFRGKGFFGYSFGPMQQKDLDVLYIESEKGHDTFMICKGVTRTYYVLAGSGYFTIDGREHSIGPGVLIEVPSGVEYSYSGPLRMLAFCKRRWISSKDTWTRWNHDVVGKEDPWSLAAASWLTRVIRVRIFGKSPTNAFLRVNQCFWNILPSSFVALRLVDWYGHVLHAMARVQIPRAQTHSTYFLGNRPELELIRRLVAGKGASDTVRVAVLGCSVGAEVYSIAWEIRKARPDLRLIMHGIDISTEAVAFAKRGVYSLKAEAGDQDIHDYGAAGCWRIGRAGSELVGAEIFDRMTAAEKTECFDLEGELASVKKWIKDGINWHVGDVKSPEILDTIGAQDIVVSSNFLCHMEDPEAERSLRNIARLVNRQGYLFVSGINLDIRARVASELRWEPVADLLEEIHEGDPCLTDLWPCQYAGLEPLNKRRQDWRIRYATAFRLAAATGAGPLRYDGAISLDRIETTHNSLADDAVRQSCLLKHSRGDGVYNVGC